MRERIELSTEILNKLENYLSKNYASCSESEIEFLESLILELECARGNNSIYAVYAGRELV